MFSTELNNGYDNEAFAFDGPINTQQPYQSQKRLRLQSFVNHYGDIKPRTSTRKFVKNHLHKFYNTLNCLCIVNSLLERIPIIRCLKEYNIRKHLFGDITGGMTVGIMNIPQGYTQIT